MKLAKYAKKELFTAWILALFFVMLGITTAFFLDASMGFTLSGVTIVLWLGFTLFFRDPERIIKGCADEILSPADGVIRDIEHIVNEKENEYFGGGAAFRIGIFLSVFDVHINRAPCNMEVTEKIHRKGKYHDARNPKASSENEAVTIVGKTDIMGNKFPVIVRQIAGAIAKKVVCELEPGEYIQKGQRYGMIKLGSRTELYLPACSDFLVNVQVGQRVFAGTSVLVKYLKVVK